MTFAKGQSVVVRWDSSWIMGCTITALYPPARYGVEIPPLEGFTELPRTALPRQGTWNLHKTSIMTEEAYAASMMAA